MSKNPAFHSKAVSRPSFQNNALLTVTTPPRVTFLLINLIDIIFILSASSTTSLWKNSAFHIKGSVCCSAMSHPSFQSNTLFPVTTPPIVNLAVIDLIDVIIVSLTIAIIVLVVSPAFHSKAVSVALRCPVHCFKARHCFP